VARKKIVGREVRHARTPARDGVAIAYTLWRRPSEELIVLAPGFWRVRLARENLYLAEHFLRMGYDVAALDFRGHGDSAGGYGFGAAEDRDFLAVVDQLVGSGRPYRRFAVVGLSLGGSIAANALAGRPDLPCRALVMISSPDDLRALRPKPWRSGAIRQVRLRHAVRVPRLSARQTLGTRKPRAADAVASLTMPKLIVTAEGDWLVDPSHGRSIAAAAAAPVEHVHLELGGALHADGLVTFVPLRLLRLLDRWLKQNAAP
jgi:alpha-beta hydrolase superfamily lysophospholipase